MLSEQLPASQDEPPRPSTHSFMAASLKSQEAATFGAPWSPSVTAHLRSTATMLRSPHGMSPKRPAYDTGQGQHIIARVM